MSGRDNTMLQEFLKHQMHREVSSVPKKAHKSIRDPGSRCTPGMEEDGIEYIIAKKPKPPKVRKYLQGLIDAITAEQED